MANTATRDSLIARTRQIADMENTTFVSDTQILGWLNVGLSELYDIMVTHFDDYFESISLFNTVNAQSDYTLPTDFYKAQGVDLVVGDISYTIKRYMNQERNRYQLYPYLWNGGWNLKYRIIGNVIRFIPTPTSAQQIRLSYVPINPSLVENTLFAANTSIGSPILVNVFIGVGDYLIGRPVTGPGIPAGSVVVSFTPGPGATITISQNATLLQTPAFLTLVNNDLINQAITPGWEEFAVLDAAMKCLMKEETDLSPYLNRQEAIRERIRQAADDRDANEPAHITDVTRAYATYGGGGMWYGY